MERNYPKEYALAIQKIAELQEQVFAYQSMLDDAHGKINETQANEKNNKNGDDE